MINLKNFKLKTTEPSDLDNEIVRLFDALKIIHPNSDEYDRVSDQLAKLYKLKEVDSKSRLSKDTMVGAVSNLAGILLIINHEHLHVITSKALGMVGKKVVS